jgi:hypothetical protein
MRILSTPSPIESFLSEPWWAGVQGLLAIVAISAIVLAVIDFLLRLNAAGPNAMTFSTRRSGVVVNGVAQITITVRPMGAHTLYEPEWRVWGFDVDIDELPEMPPILRADDEPVSVTLRVPHEKVRNSWVGVAWVVPRRWSSRAGGSRIELKLGGEYEYWKVYWWYRWPRRAPGRWVRRKAGGERSPLHIPTSDSRTAVTRRGVDRAQGD